MVPHWTSEQGVLGMDPDPLGAHFKIPDFMRDFLFPRLKNSNLLRFSPREVNLFLIVTVGISTLGGWVETKL